MVACQYGGVSGVMCQLCDSGQQAPHSECTVSECYSSSAAGGSAKGPSLSLTVARHSSPPFITVTDGYVIWSVTIGKKRSYSTKQLSLPTNEAIGLRRLASICKGADVYHIANGLRETLRVCQRELQVCYLVYDDRFYNLDRC